MNDRAGFEAVAMAASSLWRAADRLVDEVGAEKLSKLHVRAGEHLAAIITTCFLKSTPTEIDTDGGVDLVFGDAQPDAWQSYTLGDLPPAFEIKSLAGGFREVEAKISRVLGRGGNPRGMGVTVQVKSAAQLMDEIRPAVFAARKQLEQKVDARKLSRNAFVVMHPFDHMPAEILDPIIAPALTPLNNIGDLDSVWVLWHPAHLTVWSRTRHEWINLVFTALDPGSYDERFDDSGMDPLQVVELHFLKRIGSTEPSPYTYSVSGSDE
jgi:hypothetical protein